LPARLIFGEITMKIVDVLQKKAILIDLKAKDKRGAIQEMVAPVALVCGIPEVEIVQVLMERERLGSTGIGEGVGIPHGKLKKLNSLVVGFGISRKGIDFESIDNRPTHIFFLLITPENSTGLHLKLLARISRVLKSKPFRDQLLGAADAEEVYAIIQKADEDL
jgi:PTS system nitrogen regulatory IIA component